MANSLREKKINKIVYISIVSMIAVIVIFMIFFNVFGNAKGNENSNFQVADKNDYEDLDAEEANSSIGNKVEDLENKDEGEDWQAVQVTDNTQVQGQLADELNETNSSETDNNENNTQNLNPADSSEIADNTSEIVSMNIANESDEQAGIEKNDAEITNNEEPVEDPTFTIPVEGEIVKQYGKDKLIYSDTLKEWTTHLGIDIKADKTTVVKASADGAVKSIKNDPRYGLTVVIEHQNGFSSVYSNLLTAEFVVVGETVKSGQTIGTVGNSATFEILDDAHLHFELLKDGNSVDPEMYLR